MLKRNFKYQLIPILFLVFLFFPLITMGQSGQQQPLGPGQQVPIDTEIPNPLNTTDFNELVKKIANWVYQIALAVAALMFVIGGFQFLVSGGNEEKVTKAKKTLLYAAIGLAVAVLSLGFVSLIKNFFGVK